MKTKIFVIFAAISAHIFAAEPDFSAHWHDGKAELNGYRATISRYGQERNGQIVAIYVTEPFSKTKFVKVDNHTKNPDDVMDVLKLNLVRDFQTGIYDYNTMVSVFVRTSDFSPVKMSFVSTEWCGNVYEELLFFPNKITGHYYSYFEDESGPRNLDFPKDGIVGEQFLILIRGLRGEFLKAGGKKSVPFLPGLYAGRLAHKPPAWTTAEIGRRTETETVEVPAGKFETMVYAIKLGDGRGGAFYVEKNYPHRIVKWSVFPDVSVELTGSARFEYWKLNKNGDESYLKELGLGPMAE
jgi:hypothetical protein